MKLFNFKNIWLYLFGALLLIHLVTNLWWIVLNSGPIPWDSANHTYHTIKIAERLRELNLIAVLKTSNYYPLFVYLVSAIPTLIFGEQIKLLQSLGTLYFLLTLGAVFYYVKLLTNSDRIAFFSGCFFSFSAVIYNQSRLLMLDIPSVGLMVISLILLFKSEHLEKRKFAIWFFVAAALLGLTKWTALFYLVVPAFFELFYFLKSRNKIKVLKNGITGAVIFLLIMLPWYIANWEDIAYLGKVYAAGDKIANPQNPYSWEYILNYYKIYLYTQVTPIPALAFFFSLIPFMFIKKAKYRLFVLLMIIANYLFFTSITNKDGRFTMHLLVFTSLITSVVIDQIYQSKKIIGAILFGSLTIFMLFYYLLMSFRPVNWEGYKLSVNAPVFGGLELINVDDSLVKKPESDDWKFDEVIPDLVELAKPGQPFRLTVVSEWYHFNPSNIRTYLKLKGVDAEVVTPDLPYLIKKYQSDSFPTEKDLTEFIGSKDYILAVSKNIGSPYLLNMKAEQQLMSALNSKQQKCDEFTLTIAPAGTECVVREDEILTTGSDILVDGLNPEGSVKRIEGFAKVECPWGCTFGILDQPINNNTPKIEPVKQYTLPNNELVTLYKIN